MKRYLYILTLGALFSFTSCIQEDITTGNDAYYPSSNSGIHVIGASEDFDVKQVGTRSDDEVSDAFISEMTMLIFKSNGEMLTAYDDKEKKNELKSSHINIRRSNPTFLIETSKYDGVGILASMEAGTTTKYYNNTATDIDACSIYIVANAYHLIGEHLKEGKIKTKADLEAAMLDANEKLGMPYDEKTGEYIGLPMIGFAREEITGLPATFDLSFHQGDSNNNAVATIPLKKLYSKVSFSIQVNSNQLVTGQVPEFELRDVEVFNVPSLIRMGYQAGDYISNMGDNYLYRYVNDTQETSFSFSKNDMMPDDVVCRHSSTEDTDDVISFHFYMPEHKVTPNFTEDDYNYPTTLPEDDRHRQYFKPKLIEGKIATFVRIHGSYTDHNGNIHDIAYDIYLGQDEVDDFEVIRNQQLNNKLIINGITNRKDAYDGSDNTISIDHRVSMTNTGYNLSMERTALLDSHFEVRPLDIELQPRSSMTIIIPEKYYTWIAMESDAEADMTSGKYASNADRKGVRNYFTTDLISELNGTDGKGNGNNGTITIKHSGTENKKEIHRIWFYIDENPHVYDMLLDEGVITSSPNGNGSYKVNDNLTELDKRSRLATVNFYFAKDNGVPDTNAEPTTTVNFQQWNLWRVWSSDGQRYYDIEHEEEYLHNYASDDQYGQTQNGMPWGLKGKQLSNKHNSFICNENNDEWNNYISANPLKYDFYIGKHDDDNENSDEFTKDGGTLHNYAGREFTKEIAENPNSEIKYLNLSESADSAVEYCYSKNKRNSDGSVDVKWYLPSTDEMEDIIVAGYSSFKEFQDNYYWTSQPAYIRNAFYYEYHEGSKNSAARDTYAFIAYVDNTEYARATKVVISDNDDYDYIRSGLNKTPANIPEMDDYCKQNNAKPFGYFNITYAWYRWVDNYIFWKETKTGTDQWPKENERDTHFWEKIGGEDKGVRYHLHCGYLDELIQKTTVNGEDETGYRERTESNRIRAVYRSGTK